MPKRTITSYVKYYKDVAFIDIKIMTSNNKQLIHKCFNFQCTYAVDNIPCSQPSPIPEQDVQQLYSCQPLLYQTEPEPHV